MISYLYVIKDSQEKFTDSANGDFDSGIDHDCGLDNICKGDENYLGPDEDGTAITVCGVGALGRWNDEGARAGPCCRGGNEFAGECFGHGGREGKRKFGSSCGFFIKDRGYPRLAR